MNGIGSGDNGELTFMDIVGLLSFLIGLQNLDINVTQTDLQNETKRLDAKVDEKVQFALSEIHEHLEEQDFKLNEILSILRSKQNDG